MLCLVNWYVVTGVWKEWIAFMFRVKQPSKIVYFIVKIKVFSVLNQAPCNGSVWRDG